MSDFAKDVENHSMTVELDNGVHRSLYFGKGRDSCQHFRINTWPGHLCISGDMGTYVFERLDDMFEFFRGDRVNLHYWSEKVQSQSVFGEGVMEYKPEVLLGTIRDYISGQSQEVQDEVLEELSPYISSDYGAQEAFRQIYEYSGPVNFSDFTSDISSGCYQDYTVHYQWCCEAIRWAVEMYDAETSSEGTGEQDG